MTATLGRPAHPPHVAAPRLVLGTRLDGGDNVPVVLGPTQVAQHKEVLGVSGSGKSKLLVSLIVQLINQRFSVAVADPHADMVHEVLAVLLDTGYFDDPRAYERVWYVCFNRSDRHIPFNFLAQPYEAHAVARQLLEAWTRAWSGVDESSSPLLAQVLLAGAFVLIENRLPLTGLPRLLTDAGYRSGLLGEVRDPEIVAFFRSRYDPSGKRAVATSASTLRRAFLLTFTPALRGSLGQRENWLDFGDLMDRGISVLYDLSGLDEETQRLLGCLITVGYEVAALARAARPPANRRPSHLVLDEYSMFAAPSGRALTRILDLTRKFGLTLTLAHQTQSQTGTQLTPALQQAIQIVMRCTYDDAQALAPRLLAYDPDLVRYSPSRPGPISVGRHEQMQALATTLAALPAREALLRIGQTTTRLRTVTVPAPQHAPAALQQVLDSYVARLLRPDQELATAWTADGHAAGHADVPATKPTHPAPRRRVRVSD